MRINREEAKEIFLRYAGAYDMQNILIRHKVEHTLRVAELSARFAQALGMSGEDTDFSWLLGLWHDIGRFEQARRFGTFVDSQSVDHAELSGDILFQDGLINRFFPRGLPEDERAMAETAIRQHNKLNLPETLDARTRCYAEILRDADKTDIFRVIASIPFKDRISASRARFVDSGGPSPEVMTCVVEHRCVPRQLRRSPFEGRVSHCCMAFELVFDVSRETVREEGWLKAMLAETDSEGKPLWTGRETEQLRTVRREIEKAWGTAL